MINNWDELKKIKYLSSIKELPFEGQLITKNIYRVNEQAYLFLVDYNVAYNKTKENGPFATLLFWTGNDGSAKRAFSRKIEEDKEQSIIIPPTEMLPSKEVNTYEKIINELKKNKSTYMETASYRIATDGAYIHKEISVIPYTYYFRKREDDNNEVPYTISYKLQQ